MGLATFNVPPTRPGDAPRTGLCSPEDGFEVLPEGSLRIVMEALRLEEMKRSNSRCTRRRNSRAMTRQMTLMQEPANMP